MDTKKPSPEKSKSMKKAQKQKKESLMDKEVGGFSDSGLLEPTRYGDWDVKGRCSDF